ncbi:MAG: hypothetical protein INR70_27920 [Parafilimonas terrae]|nr:hypothetical protein [Parafilimonas terrae]
MSVPPGDHELTFVEISVPFTGTFSTRGTPRQVDHLLAEPYRVGIPVVGEADAPVAFRADGVAAGSRSLSVEWRDHDGSYWRPLLADDRTVLRVTAKAFAEAHPWHDFGTWQDSPFGLAFVERLFGAINPIPPHLNFGNLGTLRADRRDEAFEEASRVAACCLVEIGGVLHRKAAPPMWAVEPSAWDRVDIRAITLRFPEEALLSWPLALFPHDRLEEARAAVGEMPSNVRAAFQAPTWSGMDAQDVRRQDYEVAALGMAWRAARRLHDFAAFEDPDTTYGRMAGAIQLVEAPGRHIGDQRLDRARRCFLEYASALDVPEGVGLVRDLLMASLDAARAEEPDAGDREVFRGL